MIKIIKLGGIINSSIVNGEGIRSVLFCTGCIHCCEGCHNQHLANYESGESFTTQDIITMLEKNEKITGKKVTFSGGDPFFQAKGFAKLAKELKNRGYNIWCYTGYTIEQLLNSKNESFIELLENIDVLVDGKFDKNLQSNPPKYAGSSNQRIIKVDDYIRRQNKKTIHI